MSEDFVRFGVGLMPIIMLASSVGYWFGGANYYAAIAFILSVVMWLVLYGENKKNNHDK